jgi:phosphoribosyl 1,2-cyclic phosphate phosphodiesterase
MKVSILGSGNAAGTPVYGCHCAALVEAAGIRVLIDAGLLDLQERFAAGTLEYILLTHYHMDHVQGLFRLRWGRGVTIRVISPVDHRGCDDLYEHPGILDFGGRAQPFQEFSLGPLSVTPVPLAHSRPTLGYVIATAGRTVAYLTDTRGLPDPTLSFLRRTRLDLMVLDCTEPPAPHPAGGHNDLTSALRGHADVGPAQTLLTHIGHELNNYLDAHPQALPPEVSRASDGLVLEL